MQRAREGEGGAEEDARTNTTQHHQRTPQISCYYCGYIAREVNLQPLARESRGYVNRTLERWRTLPLRVPPRQIQRPGIRSGGVEYF